MSWEVVYEHDKQGRRVRGNLETLISTISTGADIKVIVDVNDLYTLIEYPIRVWVSNGHVYVSTLQYHFNFKPDRVQWDHKSTPFVSIWGTDGVERVNGEQYVNRFPMAWATRI